jgi:hypothetical protein
VDAIHHRFSGDGDLAGEQSLTSGTLSVTYRLPTPGTPVSPYIIAGLGAYHAACHDGLECEGSTRFGWNAGAGMKVRIIGIRTFVEARYHSAGDGAAVIPVTLGFQL